LEYEVQYVDNLYTLLCDTSMISSIHITVNEKIKLEIYIENMYIKKK